MLIYIYIYISLSIYIYPSPSPLYITLYNYLLIIFLIYARTHGMTCRKIQKNLPVWLVLSLVPHRGTLFILDCWELACRTLMRFRRHFQRNKQKSPQPDFHLLMWRLLLSLSQELPCFPSAMKKRNLQWEQKRQLSGQAPLGSELYPRFTVVMRMLGSRCACCNLGAPNQLDCRKSYSICSILFALAWQGGTPKQDNKKCGHCIFACICNIWKRSVGTKWLWGLDGFCDWPCQWSWLFLAPETWGFSLQHVVAPSASWQSPAIPAASYALLYTTSVLFWHKTCLLCLSCWMRCLILSCGTHGELNGSSSWAEIQLSGQSFSLLSVFSASMSSGSSKLKTKNARSC